MDFAIFTAFCNADDVYSALEHRGLFVGCEGGGDIQM